MISKQVKCKVVTPIISKSMDFSENQSPVYKIYSFELRPQSVKGVLHFWFRAIAPRVIDIYKLNFDNIKNEDRRKELEKIYKKENYKGLKFLESMIFGSQNQKAEFCLIVKYSREDTVPIVEITFDRNNKKKLRFNINLQLTNKKDLLYPLYGTYLLSRNQRDNFVCECLKPQSIFKLVFLAKDEYTWNVIYSILKIVSVLSGFGAKTTKGFGQFEIINDKDFHRGEYVSKEKIEELIKQAEKALIGYINENDKDRLIVLGKSSVPEFPNLAEGSFEFYGLLETGTEWSEVMSRLYYLSRSNRGWYRQLKYSLRKMNQKINQKENSNRDAVKDLIECLEGRSKEVEISPAILGMPLQYQKLKSRVEKITFYPKVPGEEDDRGRKPSPLKIIINKSGQHWAAYGLLLKSKLTSDEQLIYDISSDFKAKLTTTFDELDEKIKKNEEGGRNH